MKLTVTQVKELIAYVESMESVADIDDDSVLIFTRDNYLGILEAYFDGHEEEGSVYLEPFGD